MDWLTATFNNWKLDNVNREAWGTFGKSWSTEKVYVAMKEPYYHPLIAHPAAFSLGTNGMISNEVVLLSKTLAVMDSAYIDKISDSIKGKIVMIKLSDTIKLTSAFEAFAKRYNAAELDTLPDAYMTTRAEMDTSAIFFKKLYQKILYMQAKGAVALLGKSTGSRDGTVFAQGADIIKGYPPLLPIVPVALEDFLMMQRILLDKIPVKIEMDIENKFYDSTVGYNMVGEISGTDAKLKDEVVMLGGHLDSWQSATGATDNAAGCAVMIESMRILKALNIHPRRTIRIALWGGEEQELYGSFGYVKKHFGNPADMILKPEQKKISAYYNLDNGSGKIRGIYLQNNEKVHDIFKAWLAPFVDMDATGITKSNTGSTDHLSFDAIGIPAFQFIQDPLEYESRTHHSNMDTYDHLSMDDLHQAAVIVAAFIYNTAMRDEMLPRKPLPPAEKFVFDIDEP